MNRHPSEVIAMERRAFVKRSGLLIALCVAGERILISPAEAAVRALPYAFLTEAEAATIGHLCEAIVPGAGRAGVTHFIDSQLAADPNDSLLIARYFGVAPPYGDFYRTAIEALEISSRMMFGAACGALPTDKARKLAMALFSDKAPGWNGPPAPLFYQCVRSDAVDVVYGTPAGFEALGIPYMEHILPPEGWQ